MPRAISAQIWTNPAPDGVIVSLKWVRWPQDLRGVGNLLVNDKITLSSTLAPGVVINGDVIEVSGPGAASRYDSVTISLPTMHVSKAEDFIEDLASTIKEINDGIESGDFGHMSGAVNARILE